MRKRGMSAAVIGCPCRSLTSRYTMEWPAGITPPAIACQ
jgi:hypothetical protein